MVKGECLKSSPSVESHGRVTIHMKRYYSLLRITVVPSSC